jgi:hypothetical protein
MSSKSCFPVLMLWIFHPHVSERAYEPPNQLISSLQPIMLTIPSTDRNESLHCKRGSWSLPPAASLLSEFRGMVHPRLVARLHLLEDVAVRATIEATSALNELIRRHNGISAVDEARSNALIPAPSISFSHPSGRNTVGGSSSQSNRLDFWESIEANTVFHPWMDLYASNPNAGTNGGYREASQYELPVEQTE